MQLNVILHSIDFSESATHALRLAVHLATSHQARLVIFHADSLHGEHLEAEDGALDRYAATARDLMEHDVAGSGSAVEVSQERTVPSLRRDNGGGCGPAARPDRHRHPRSQSFQSAAHGQHGGESTPPRAM